MAREVLMRLPRLFLLAVIFTGPSWAFAEEPKVPPVHTRPYTVMCAPTIKVWIDVDGGAIATREPVSLESRKRAPFKLIGSAPYRGDAVLCNYATPHRDVTTSYSVRCREPRKQRGHRHSYLCR